MPTIPTASASTIAARVGSGIGSGSLIGVDRRSVVECSWESCRPQDPAPVDFGRDHDHDRGPTVTGPGSGVDDAPDYTTIQLEASGPVVVLTLDRPEKMNTFTVRMAIELLDALDRIDATPSVRVLVVTGAGRAFCAGADLSAGEPPSTRATPRSRPGSRTWPSVSTRAPPGARSRVATPAAWSLCASSPSPSP